MFTLSPRSRLEPAPLKRRRLRSLPFCCILAGLVAGGLAGAGPAAAMTGDGDGGIGGAPQDEILFAGTEPMDNSELGDLRGGFMVAGLEFNFAVEIRTTFQNAQNETVGLVTSINFDDHGATTRSYTVGNLPEGATSVTAGAPGSVQAVLNTEATRILHDVSLSKLNTVISNTANQVNVNQDMRMDVVAPNFSSFAKDFVTTSHLRQLGDITAQLGLGHR